MMRSLFPVSNRTLPFGCRTTKKVTGTWTWVACAPPCRKFFGTVSIPDVNAYIRMPAGDCASAGTVPTSSPRRRTMARVRDRFMADLPIDGALRSERSSALI